MGKVNEKLVKEWYRKHLLENGYDSAEIVKSPADIKATKDGETWWFEIKYTTAKDSYYGGSTETEWEQAFKCPERFRFVIIQTNKSGTKFKHKEYAPEDFIRYCAVPPFSITFTIRLTPYKKARNTQKEDVKSIRFSKELFEEMHEFFNANRKKNF